MTIATAFVSKGTDFDAYRQNAAADIDKAAVTARAKYLTPGQDYTYYAKGTEAKNYINAGSPNPTNTANTSNWPYLCADANATMTANLAVSANNILNAKATADPKAATIEGLRLEYRGDILAMANNTAQIDNAAVTYIQIILSQ